MKTTNLYIILDKSGSMSSVAGATISGLNEYVGTLKRDKNRYNLSLTLFDTEVEQRYENTALPNVPEFTGADYRPGGNTALYDAVCHTLRGLEGQEGKNLVVIMTDGQENSSKEYKREDMQKLIKTLEGKGNWTFVYMGANQDSYTEAANFGIHVGNVVNYSASAAGVGSVMRAASVATASFATMDSMSLDGASETSSFYSKSLRKEVEDTK